MAAATARASMALPRASTAGAPLPVSAEEADDAFTSELLSYSLERLNKEPELLRADGDRVRRQMQELAVGQYRAFIKAAECTDAVRTQVAGMRDHLEALQQGLPALSAGCAHFAEAAERIAAARAQNRQLLQQHGTLLELLELGSLLDTCVRNGSYDEALELEALCGRLAAAAPGVPLAAALASDARAGVRAMLAQLLQRLRGPVQLPECLRAVGYLRRLGAFTEAELRLAFLRSRDAWLRTCIAELDAAPAAGASAAASAAAASPAEAAKRLTDAHRVHLFDAVMQYRAIFADDTAAADAAAGAAQDGGLLAAWAAARVGSYLAALGGALGRIAEGAPLASVLEHATYCGASLGRVGLDFRPLLPPMFEAAAGALVRNAFSVAGDSLDAALHTHRWPTGAAPPPSLPAVARPAAVAAAGGEDEPAAPPVALMEAPPVAALLNGVLAALNELRHVAHALPGLRAPLAAALHDTLAGAAAALARQGAPSGPPLGEAHAAQLAAFASALADTAAPYCAACYGRVYAGAAAAVDAAAAVTPARELASRLQQARVAAAPAAV